MKKIFIIISVIFLAACQMNDRSSAEFTINARVNGIEEGQVFLQDRVHGLWVNVDSTFIENGTFSFNGSLAYPKMQYLSIQGVPQRLMIFTDNSEIELIVDAMAPADYTVEGSASHTVFSDFNHMLAIHDTEISQKRQQILEAEIMDQQDQVDSAKQDYENAQEVRKQAIHDFVNQHSDKTVAIFIASRNLAPAMDGQELTALVNSFDPKLRNTSYYITLSERAEKLMLVEVGKQAPDFTLADTDGQPVSLSDFRGRYVLVSFWASWCPFCRVENPHLVKLYDQYQGYNFEILGVSLDRDHNAWIEAIAHDGITWPQISDLKGWQNEASSKYAVSSIPANVFLDPQGIIIGRNLRDEALDQKLAELLSQPI